MNFKKKLAFDMTVSIGILARNESGKIEDMLCSLFGQSVFNEYFDDLDVKGWEIIVVPNGCDDDTWEIAENFFLRHPVANKLACKVISIKLAGKSNAWNEFIHKFSQKESRTIMMIDADIEFGHPDTILNSLRELDSNAECTVVVDLPLKDFAKKTRLSFVEKISLRLSDEKLAATPAIAGSFYCARADTLRAIWMPPGLIGEDGFLKAMLATDLFRREYNSSKIARAVNALHYYEGLTSVSSIYRHELRMVMGTALNCYLCWDFLLFATDPQGPGAGVLIKNRLDMDEGWYRKLIGNSIRNRGWWVLPKGLAFQRISSLRFRSLRKLPLQFLLALCADAVTLPILLMANYKLKKGAIGYW